MRGSWVCRRTPDLCARAGLIAGLMLALYPPAIFFDALVQKSVLDVFFVCVSLAVIARIVRGKGEPLPTRRAAWWVALGLSMGALALTRENALVLIAVVAVWAATLGARDDYPRTRRTRRTDPSRPSCPSCRVRSLGVGVVSAAGGRSATTSWAAGSTSPPRSSARISTSATTRAPTAATWRSATGADRRSTSGWMRPSWPSRRADVRLTPAEVSSYWTGQTAGLCAVRARRLAALAGAQDVASCSTAPRSSIRRAQESHAEYSWPLALLGPVWHFGILLPLAVTRCGASLAGSPPTLAASTRLTAVYAASVVLFFVVARYRLPLVPLLIVFAAGWFAGDGASVRRPSRRRFR